MQFTISTKDQHYLIAFLQNDLTTASVSSLSVALKAVEANNVVVDLGNLTSADEEAVAALNALAEKCKKEELSFLGFGLMEKYLSSELFQFEITPTLTEAQDIVFMEIVERDLNTEL